jgi:hypothetical protein
MAGSRAASDIHCHVGSSVLLLHGCASIKLEGRRECMCSVHMYNHACSLCVQGLFRNFLKRGERSIERHALGL